MPVMRFDDQRQILDQHAGVDGHVVHALLRLLLDHFQHDLGGEVFDLLDPRDALVDGHGADGHGRVPQDGFADLRDVAAGGEVHHRVGAVVHRGVQLLQLLVDVRGDGRVADVGVDLAQRGHADRHRLQLGMVDVGGDDHAPARHFVAHQLRRELLALGHVEHLFRDQALARIVHLREVAVAGARRLCSRRAIHSGAQLGSPPLPFRVPRDAAVSAMPCDPLSPLIPDHPIIVIVVSPHATRHTPFWRCNGRGLHPGLIAESAVRAASHSSASTRGGAPEVSSTQRRLGRPLAATARVLHGCLPGWQMNSKL